MKEPVIKIKVIKSKEATEREVETKGHEQKLLKAIGNDYIIENVGYLAWTVRPKIKSIIVTGGLRDD